MGIACRALINRFKSTCWIWLPLTYASGTGWKLLSTVMRYLFISRSSKSSVFSTNSVRLVGSWPAERLRAMPKTEAGDLRGPMAGQQDLLERLFPRRGVFVAQAQLGVVDDHRQDVIELVRGGADQFADRRKSLHLGNLLLEEVDLLLQIGPQAVVVVRHG